jgi:glycyl-tRNA synthetase beta chain
MENKSASQSIAQDILFEIGTEELPATMLADIFSQSENWLEARLKKVFEEKRVGFEKAAVYATPRRLVFFVEKAAARQSSHEQLIKLIPKSEAYSSDGRPTEKLLTILKHRSVSLEELVTWPLAGKDTVFIRKTALELLTLEVLPEIFAALLKSLSFAKTMKWGLRWEDGSDFYFPRPVRSLACFYGQKPLLFKMLGLSVSGKITIFSKGRRKKYSVKTVKDYFGLMRKQKIELDPLKRKEMIAQKLTQASSALKARLYEDPFLLGEVNFLVESPEVVSAPFDESFLKLPLEVLIVSMARKQRIFGLLDSQGKVQPRFLGLLDDGASGADKKVISRNYEHILHAKLQDSLFFYKEDTKVPLEKKRQELGGLIFLKGAGSMLEKSDRLVRLSQFLGKELKLSSKDQRDLEKACFLSKSDLLTQMVGEFPELQGVIGKYYALENGQEPAAAEAIGEQHLPRTVQDPLPRTLPGALLSILDKCDLIVASFALGNEPSSSADPFGLRRSAGAVVKMILEKELRFSFLNLILENQKALGAYVPKDKQSVLAQKVTTFFKDRFKAVMLDRGYADGLLEAVMASGFEDLGEVFLRARALSEISKESFFPKAWKVVERTSNIVKAGKEASDLTIEPSVFTQELERRVFEKYQSSSDAIRRAQASMDYRLATSLYAEAFFDILSEFFEKVFVNDEDLRVRKNRLALLGAVQKLYTEKIADLSKMKI